MWEDLPGDFTQGWSNCMGTAACHSLWVFSLELVSVSRLLVRGGRGRLVWLRTSLLRREKLIVSPWFLYSTSPMPSVFFFFFPFLKISSFFLFKKKLIYFNWRLITLQFCSGFCHTLTWISHGCTCVPHPVTPSHLPPHPTPQGHASAPALSSLSHAKNLDWRSISHMVIYMFQCYSVKSSHPCLLPQSPKVWFPPVQSLSISFLKWIYLFIYLFAAVGLSCGMGLFVATCSIFYCAARTLWLRHKGLVAPWHAGGGSPTRDWTRVSCIARQTLNC